MKKPERPAPANIPSGAFDNRRANPHRGVIGSLLIVGFSGVSMLGLSHLGVNETSQSTATHITKANSGERVQQIVSQDPVNRRALETIFDSPSSIVASVNTFYPAGTQIYSRPANLSETGDSSTDVIDTVPNGQHLEVKGLVTSFDELSHQPWQLVTIKKDGDNMLGWVQYDPNTVPVYDSKVDDSIVHLSAYLDGADLYLHGFQPENETSPVSYHIGQGEFLPNN
jgi:hypothetical protein